MKDLNGCYCLGTKEHFDKLIELEYWVMGSYAKTAKYYFINNGAISGNEEIQNMTMIATKPMHLRNNEWVFGSLEPEEVINIATTTDVDFQSNYKEEHSINYSTKPVESITREEAVKKLSLFNESKEKLLNKVFDYIEYLETNQKEK